MIDIPSQLAAIYREVGLQPADGGESVGVLPSGRRRPARRRELPARRQRATLELEHTVPLEIAQSGPGALYVGPGWDGAFMALDLFLRGEVAADPVAAASSPEAQEFSKHSVHAWTAVVESSGTATADEVAAATDVSLAQFAPDQL